MQTNEKILTHTIIDNSLQHKNSNHLRISRRTPPMQVSFDHRQVTIRRLNRLHHHPIHNFHSIHGCRRITDKMEKLVGNKCVCVYKIHMHDSFEVMFLSIFFVCLLNIFFFDCYSFFFFLFHTPMECFPLFFCVCQLSLMLKTTNKKT